MSDERSFSEVKTRLDEIVEEISSDSISLDDALSLYEEAVSLGLVACDLSETDIFGDDEDIEQQDESESSSVGSEYAVKTASDAVVEAASESELISAPELVSEVISESDGELAEEVGSASASESAY